MKKSPLKGLVIRTAVVASPDYGVIYAGDPKQERKQVPHTLVFAFEDGEFHPGDYNYSAHSACLIDKPSTGIVDVSEAGYYTANTESELFAEDLFTHSKPPSARRRSRGLRGVYAIGGVAHAVGLRGMVYRLTKLRQWTRIDAGLPETFDVQAIHGLGPKKLYAVGRAGALWQYDGAHWTHRPLPTKENLTAVMCAPDGTTYIAGHHGTLLRAKGATWSAIPQRQTDEDIWDLEWFEGTLYASTMTSVYRLEGEKLTEVDFGKHRPKTCYQLSAADGVMWSSGENDVVSFDGTAWSRIV